MLLFMFNTINYFTYSTTPTAPNELNMPNDCVDTLHSDHALSVSIGSNVSRDLGGVKTRKLFGMKNFVLLYRRCQI